MEKVTLDAVAAAPLQVCRLALEPWNLVSLEQVNGRCLMTLRIRVWENL